MGNIIFFFFFYLQDNIYSYGYHVVTVTSYPESNVFFFINRVNGIFENDIILEVLRADAGFLVRLKSGSSFWGRGMQGMHFLRPPK